MPKFCVFCGNKPVGKNKEHVIPEWLIEMTGELSRTATFGLNKNFENGFKNREWAFGQFTFPACGGCNAKYSTLESYVKAILLKILDGIEIRSEELSLFLNWLDKVRVGLWLGMKQLDAHDNNSVMIEPNFHIDNRIGQYDRMLIVEKSDGQKLKLNFGGVDTSSFAITPSAFTLIVNNFYFTNISSMFFLSRRLGYPFPEKTFFSPNSNRFEAEFYEGRERIMRPVIRRVFYERGTKIYQPMFAGRLIEGDLSFYKSNYVRRHSLDHRKGIGNLFVDREGYLAEYEHEALININPGYVHDDRKLHIQSVINILKWQNWLSELQPSLERLPREERQKVREDIKEDIRFNNLLIKHHERLLTQ